MIMKPKINFDFDLQALQIYASLQMHLFPVLVFGECQMYII